MSGQNTEELQTEPQKIRTIIKVMKRDAIMAVNSKLKELGFVLHGANTDFIFWRCPNTWSSEDLNFVQWEVDK